jgi:hypothetical protein
MYFIKKKYEPDVTVLKEKLRHWFRFGHLRPEQGIALLIGLEPNVMCVETLVHWGENNINDEKTLDYGVALLHGCIICSWLQSGNYADQTIDRYLSRNFPERARTIFSSYVYHHRQLLQYWNSDEHPERTPLKYFVKWAISKGLNPYWESDFLELEQIQEENSENDGEQPENQNSVDAKCDRLLKQVAALAITLAMKSGQYKKGDKPNAFLIANNTVEILDALPDANTRGVGVSSIRSSIKEGLELLTTINK